MSALIGWCRGPPDRTTACRETLGALIFHTLALAGSKFADLLDRAAGYVHRGGSGMLRKQ
ncbi:hypothetical protein [Nocardia fluminea]|uniref:hypothetical protein n=1 Tax=Nocardia fluminea TaxID=134984 RepID=UPI003D0FB186